MALFVLLIKFDHAVICNLNCILIFVNFIISLNIEHALKTKAQISNHKLIQSVYVSVTGIIFRLMLVRTSEI